MSCSRSLIIFAALCWIHSNKQTTYISFSIVGGFRFLKIQSHSGDKSKYLSCHLCCVVCWPPPTFPSLCKTYTLPAHPSCRQVIWLLLPQWGAPDLLRCILPQEHWLGWNLWCDRDNCSTGCWGLCHVAPPLLSKCLLFWEELLALFGMPCFWLAAVQTAVFGCLGCAVGAVL